MKSSKSVLVVIAAVSTLFIASRDCRPQSSDAEERRFEVGGQFTLLNISTTQTVDLRPVICFVPPCPFAVTVDRSLEATPGFGGRIGYNLTNNIALEAEVNFFPSRDSFLRPGDFRIGGNKTEGLFGVRIGKRFEKIGIFGKARPGFLIDSAGDLQPARDRGCPAVFPPPIGCFDPLEKRSFAMDLGGVMEFYPTKRTIVRVDAGDTMIRLTERTAAGFLVFTPGLPPTFLTGVRLPAETTHNFQFSIGAGFRF